MRKYWACHPFQELTSERKQAALQKQQFLPTPLATCLCPWGFSLFIIRYRLSYFTLVFVLDLNAECSNCTLRIHIQRFLNKELIKSQILKCTCKLSAHLELFTHFTVQPLADILAENMFWNPAPNISNCLTFWQEEFPNYSHFLDGYAPLLAFYSLCSWPVETSCDIRLMFVFWSSFQWWIFSLWLCPLATKHQPAPWVIVCGYNSVGRDQYVAESGTSLHEQHPACNYITHHQNLAQKLCFSCSVYKTCRKF